jgi:hypothetical protein
MVIFNSYVKLPEGIYGETSANGRTFQLVKWDFNGFEWGIEWGFSVDGKNWKVES